MKKIKKLFLILTLLFVFSNIYAKTDYSIENLKIVAEIQENGSVKVEEYVQYKTGYINGVLYNIDYEGYGGLKDIEVFYEENGELKPAHYNSSKKKGTYIIDDEEGVAKFRLYYPLYRDRKWFLFKYTLPVGVNVYNDVAQFNRKMVGKNWEKDIKNILINITLPKETDIEKIHAFGHGALNGEVSILNGKEISYVLQNYKKGDFVETNILFPVELVSKVSNDYKIDEYAFDKIMKMEKREAQKANIKRFFYQNSKSIPKIIVILGVIWGVFLLFIAYLKNGKSHKVKIDENINIKNFTNEISPAVAGAILKGYVNSDLLFATVVDFIRKGVFEVEEKNNKTYLVKNLSYAKNLKYFEIFLIDWYINRIGDREKVAIEDIEIYVSHGYNAQIFGEYFMKWKELVFTELYNMGVMIDRRKGTVTRMGTITVISSFFITPFLATITRQNIVVVLPIFYVIVMILMGKMKRYTLEGEKIRKKCQNFKKYLEEYSSSGEAKTSSLHIWEEYLPYAIAFEISEKVTQGYRKIFSQEDVDRTHTFHRRRPLMYMYHLRNHYYDSLGRVTRDAGKIGENIYLRSIKSSSRGRGGGFSGGSSGGGGGRSGGGAF